MPRTYQHLFFDLDHTLWDFERNSDETLAELYDEYDLCKLGASDLTSFLGSYREINRLVWHWYDHDQITRDELRDIRFKMVLEKTCAFPPDLPLRLGEAYLQRCPHKAHVMPHAHEVLGALQERYTLHVLTNGFNETQAVKMQATGLDVYFDQVVTAERAGAKKPHYPFFRFALDCTAAKAEQCLMIGDNLDADMGGARSANIDTAYFNPPRQPHRAEVTYEVACLRELLNFL